MVAAERSNDGGLVGQNDLVVGAGREETLEESDGRVEDDSALNTSLDADLDLVVVDEIRANPFDVRGRLAVEVGRTDLRAEAMGLNLYNGQKPF